MKRSLLLFLAGPMWAQDALSLRDAVRLALRENQSVAAAGAGIQAAMSKTAEARAGRLPKVDYLESFTRSNNPVFVFSSLLTQHQFGLENFAIGQLNRPSSLNNFQSVVSVDQQLYDGRRTREALKSAGLGVQMSAEEKRRAEMEVIAGVVRAYYGAVLASESVRATEQALRSAEADLKRAESVREAGMSTDVDVLSLRVHLAAVTEQRIQRAADLDVARARLNDAMGRPLDSAGPLTTSLQPLAVAEFDLASLERQAAAERPEARGSRLAADAADVQAAAARSALLPQVGFHAAFEADRQRFVNQGGANWLVSVGLRWNLFNGMGDKARIEEANHWATRARAEARRVNSAVQLDVRRAWADLRAAQQRIEVAQAAVAEAEESLRITQNRYEAGMSNVTDLLRTETAVTESRTRYLAAVHDQRIAAVMVELASGKLSTDSEVLQ